MSKELTGADMPRLGWMGQGPLDLARFDAITAVDYRIGPDVTKPGGGLWTMPCFEHAGVLLSDFVVSSFSRHGNSDTVFTEVIPNPDAKVYSIDSPADLDEAIERWPDHRNNEPFTADLHWAMQHGDCIDWPAMATEFDAFHLDVGALSKLNMLDVGYTDDGRRRRIGARGQRQPRSRHLFGWDFITVLWLQPAFTVGEEIPITKERIAAWDDAKDKAWEDEAVALRQRVIDQAVAAGHPFPQHMLDLNPVLFLMVLNRMKEQTSDS